MTDERHHAERTAIRNAMARLLTQDNKPSINDLRLASGVQARWILTHRHVDLKDEFLDGVARRWGKDAPAQAALHKKHADLQDKYNRQRARMLELEQLVDVYAAVIDELTVQLANVSRSAPADNVTMLPRRR